MSDLHLGPPSSRSPLPAVLAAAGILAVVAAAVFFLNPRKTAEITINSSETKIYTGHTTMAALPGSVHVVGTVSSADDDLFVAVNLHISNKLRLPLFVKEVTAVLTSPDNTIADADVVNPADLPNLTVSFPDLGPLVAHPLAHDAQIANGTTTEGVVLLHFPHMTADNWRARKHAELTVNYFHQSPQTIPIP